MNRKQKRHKQMRMQTANQIPLGKFLKKENMTENEELLKKFFNKVSIKLIIPNEMEGLFSPADLNIKAIVLQCEFRRGYYNIHKVQVKVPGMYEGEPHAYVTMVERLEKAINEVDKDDSKATDGPQGGGKGLKLTD